MQQCDKTKADLTIDGAHYELESLAELKRIARLRGAKGVLFADYSFTFKRLEALHKRELARRRSEQRAGQVSSTNL